MKLDNIYLFQMLRAIKNQKQSNIMTLLFYFSSILHWILCLPLF